MFSDFPLRYFFSGDLLQLSANQLAICLAGLHCVLQACVLHLTKPLMLLKILQELNLCPEHIEKIVSLWALNAQSLVNRSRGNLAIQVGISIKKILLKK